MPQVLIPTWVIELVMTFMSRWCGGYFVMSLYLFASLLFVAFWKYHLLTISSFILPCQRPGKGYCQKMIDRCGIHPVRWERFVLFHLRCFLQNAITIDLSIGLPPFYRVGETLVSTIWLTCNRLVSFIRLTQVLVLPPLKYHYWFFGTCNQ